MEERYCIYCGQVIEENDDYIIDNNGNIFCSYECLGNHYDNDITRVTENFDMYEYIKSPTIKSIPLTIEEPSAEDKLLIATVELTDKDILSHQETEEKPKLKKVRHKSLECECCGKKIYHDRLMYNDNEGKHFCSLSCLCKFHGIEYKVVRYKD